MLLPFLRPFLVNIVHAQSATSSLTKCAREHNFLILLPFRENEELREKDGVGVTTMDMQIFA